MKPDERICRQPMPSDGVPAVDERHARVGVVDERVGERHPGRARADHEVVDVDERRHLPSSRRMTTRGKPSVSSASSIVATSSKLVAGLTSMPTWPAATTTPRARLRQTHRLKDRPAFGRQVLLAVRPD